MCLLPYHQYVDYFQKIKIAKWKPIFGFWKPYLYFKTHISENHIWFFITEIWVWNLYFKNRIRFLKYKFVFQNPNIFLINISKFQKNYWICKKITEFEMCDQKTVFTFQNTNLFFKIQIRYFTKYGFHSKIK